MMVRELKDQLRQRDVQIKEQAARINELEKQVEELKKLLVEKAKSKESKPPKEATNYSVTRHERKQRKKHRRKKSTGRKPKDGKPDLATETVDLYWHGAHRKKCVLRRDCRIGRGSIRFAPRLGTFQPRSSFVGRTAGQSRQVANTHSDDLSPVRRSVGKDGTRRRCEVRRSAKRVG
ncbi:MAG: hypothetical protein GXP24_11910 [Planctomycetes bacterium]|nr:hypothetical protein [Planctomycetota bacterium]